MADGKVVIGIDMDTKGFDLEIKATEEKLDTLIEEYQLLKKDKPFEGQEKELIKMQEEIEKTRNRLVDLKKKQDDLNKNGLSKISTQLSSIGGSVEKITKKVIKWGLAIFSVRSAYMFIRQSVSTLSQYDDKMATNLEYIRWALATAIKPIIEWIISAVYGILGFINSIAEGVFGINLFANATADAFVKAKKSLKDSNKEARELQKTLAGFDEMTILQKDGSTSPIGTPSVDLGNTFNPEQAEGIKNFWKEIFDFWEKDWEEVFNNLDGQWGAFFAGLILTVKGLWDTLKGVGELIIGLGEMLIGVLTGDFDMVKQGFQIFIEGIKNIIKGVLEFIEGILLTVLGLVKGIVIGIWNFIYDKLIKPIIDVLDSMASWVNDKAKKLVNGLIKIFTGLWNGIKNGVSTATNAIKDVFGGIANWINNKVIKPIGNFFESLWNGIKKGVKAVADTISSIFDSILDTIRGVINTLIDGVNFLIKGANAVNPFGSIPYIDKLEKHIPGRTGASRSFAKGGIMYSNQLPKLAVGGIINMPGRGVPLGIGGERGAEAIVPLTDSQQMALLGETIGRYITVNANITTTMNGRVISRELQKVQNDSDFAYNR